MLSQPVRCKDSVEGPINITVLNSCIEQTFGQYTIETLNWIRLRVVVCCTDVFNFVVILKLVELVADELASVVSYHLVM